MKDAGTSPIHLDSSDTAAITESKREQFEEPQPQNIKILTHNRFEKLHSDFQEQKQVKLDLRDRLNKIESLNWHHKLASNNVLSQKSAEGMRVYTNPEGKTFVHLKDLKRALCSKVNAHHKIMERNRSFSSLKPTRAFGRNSSQSSQHHSF